MNCTFCVITLAAAMLMVTRVNRFSRSSCKLLTLERLVTKVSDHTNLEAPSQSLSTEDRAVWCCGPARTSRDKRVDECI